MAVNATSKLSLNEACEAPYHLSPHLLNAGSFSVIAPAALYAAYTLMSLKRKDPFGWHACLAQLAYHVTHAYIHAFVDMGFKENTDYWNNVLVFHFAHQSATLGSLYFNSFPKGCTLGFGAVYLSWGLTGWIYPAVWGYLLTVFVFRSIMGWPIVLSSVYTGIMTVLEVKFCDPVGLRTLSSLGWIGAPAVAYATHAHIVADMGQAASVYLQCNYLSKRNSNLPCDEKTGKVS